MNAEGKSPFEVLDLPEGATLEAIEAAFARGIRLLDNQSLASYGMFDDTSSDTLRLQLASAYEQLKAQATPGPGPSVGPSSAPVAAAGRQGPKSEQPAHDPSQRQQGPEVQAAAVAATQGPPPQAPAAALGLEHPHASQAAQGPDAPQGHSTPHAKAMGVPLPASAPPPAARPQRQPVRVRLCAPRSEPLPGPLTGQLLRELREQLGAEVDDVCEVTKINRRYIVALEEEDFSLLPATVYVRGFISEYARVLGLAHQATQPYVEAYAKWSNAHA